MWHERMKLSWKEAELNHGKEVTEFSLCCLCLDPPIPEAGTAGLLREESHKFPLLA
jgi:hypothetical protein